MSTFYEHELVPLGDVINQVYDDDNHHRDDYVSYNNIEAIDVQTIRVRGAEYQMKEHAARQFCSRLHTKMYGYIKDLPVAEQKRNLDYWVNQMQDDGDHDNLLFRFNDYDNSLRAVLSHRYQVLDNYDIADYLVSQCYDLDQKVQVNYGENVWSLSIPDHGSDLSINGDKMVGGVTITNSETGYKSFSLSAFVFRLVCTNGLIRRKNMGHHTYRHTGHDLASRFQTIFDGATNRLQESFSETAARLEAAMQLKISEPDQVFDDLNKKHSVSIPEREAVKWAWPYEYGDTMFNIINTYTRAAHYEVLKPESSFNLQLAAGEILSSVKPAA